MIELVKVQTDAPKAYMIPKAAVAFGRLREIVRRESGIDFLARCGDVYRVPDFVSSKDGVANRSWHKTGRAFDYDQSSKALIIVSEMIGGKQYFRTYLRCFDQTGKQGFKKHLRDYRPGSSNSYVFDFTAAAKVRGFNRIPAWSGWQKNYNRREFWHYQLDEGLTWAAAMAQLAGSGHPESIAKAKCVFSLNDRGSEVRSIQAALSKLGHLPAAEVDGVFGSITFAAVKKFQAANGLSADGIAGPKTLKALGL